MSWRYKGPTGSGALSDIGSHLIDLAEFVCGPIQAVRGAVLPTVIAERPLPLGAAVGHAAAEVSDVTEPVENEDLAGFTVAFASGAAGTFSVSRVAYGLPNALGFEVFTEAFLEQVAGLDRLPRVASFAEGLHNMRLLDAVVASAKAGGAEVAVD
jgi:predicted dehydrogenase